MLFRDKSAYFYRVFHIRVFEFFILNLESGCWSAKFSHPRILTRIECLWLLLIVDMNVGSKCILLYISNSAKWLYNGNQHEPTLVFWIWDLSGNWILVFIEFVRCWVLDVSVIYGTFDVRIFRILRND